MTFKDYEYLSARVQKAKYYLDKSVVDSFLLILLTTSMVHPLVVLILSFISGIELGKIARGE